MTENHSAIRYERDGDGIVVLTLDDPTASANTMNELYGRSMEEAVARLEEEKGEITGVVITSAKKTFFAGGNLNDLLSVGPDQAEDVFEKSQALKAQLRRLEKLGVPTVAAINGAALGGGLEIALAFNHRIAVDGRYEIGLPEVTLGLLPGGGGVTRVTRLLGVSSALMDVLLQGQRYKPEAAQAKGLVHELVATQDELLPAAKAWVLANADNEDATTQPWDRKGYKMPGGTPSHPSLAQMLPAFPAGLRKQLKGAQFPAPEAIMSASVEGAQVDFDTACRIESRYFANAGHRPERQEHDPGVLLRPAADQLRRAASRGCACLQAHQGRRARRRDDGRGHRLRLCPRRPGGRAQGRRAGVGRAGQGLLGEDQREGRLPRQADAGEVRRAARPDHARPTTLPTPRAATSSSRPSSRTRR